MAMLPQSNIWEEKKKDMLKKVIVRNLYLSGIPLDMIALQVDMDVPTVLTIIEEVTKWIA